MKKIWVGVSNDIYNDNRVKKTCGSLVGYGLEVHLLCKKGQNKDSDINSLVKLHPISFVFSKNFLFYAELNIRFFFSLLFRRFDLLWSNDLDTLPAFFLASRLRNKPLIFDSHEMFTCVAELQNNPFAKKVWQLLEKSMLPHLKYIATVCESIKDYFKQKYNVDAVVIRNIPIIDEKNFVVKHYPLSEKIIVWQGAANIDRSLEDIVEAMKSIDAKLYIVGRGDVLEDLKKRIENNSLQDKVFLLGRLPFDKMMSLTRRASIGLSLDRPTNENYKISLPNKIFEYIDAATPVICTPLKEIKIVVEKYRTGVFLQTPIRENIVRCVNNLIEDNDTLQRLSDNCVKARRELSWQQEEKRLFALVDLALKRKTK